MARLEVGMRLAICGRIVMVTGVLVSAILSASFASAATSPSPRETRLPSAEDLIQVRKPANVSISPDGKWVSFVLTTPDLAGNQYVHDVYVVPVDGSSPPRQLTHNEPTSGPGASVSHLSLVWSPDSDRLVYIADAAEGAELRGLDIRTGQEAVLVTQAELPSGVQMKQGPFSSAESIAFSPDGQLLAFIGYKASKVEPVGPLTRAIEAGLDWTPADTGAELVDPIGTLFVLDLASRKVRAITDSSLHVATFAWSPDSNRLALEAVADFFGFARYMRGDIYVAGASGDEQPVPIVQMDGWDRLPTWSPDGKKIAFCTQGGVEDWRYTCSLAVVPADGGAAPRNIGKQVAALTGHRLSSIQWRPNGRHIDVAVGHRLGSHVFRVAVEDGTARRLTPRDDRHYAQSSYSADGNWMALTVQGVAIPPDIYVTSTKAWAPKRLTHLNPQWNDLRTPSVEIVKWRSKDDRWDIHGLLLKPSDYAPGKRYPLLTEIRGGPGMVDQRLNSSLSYPLLALAEQGYVILVPNSRGRQGFGLDFAYAIRDEQSYVLNPASDVLAGVDAMVAAGIADPKKLGILGFSYGGTLTSYIITSTDRFKAAIYGEGDPNLLEWYHYLTTASLRLARDLQGFGNPYEPEEIRRGFEQSSIFRLNKVRTPLLLEAGERSTWKQDRALFRGLQYFGIPSEFYIYPRSGHGWDEPLLLQDAYRRHIAWFNYWIKDEPYSDATKQRAYDAWKQKNAMDLSRKTAH